MLRWFLNADNRLRYIWRAAIFFVLAAFVVPFLLQYPLVPLQRALHIGNGLSADGIGFGEFVSLLVALISTLPFALYEHCSLLRYGFSLRPNLGPLLGEGFVLGAVMAGLVALGMIALGGMQVQGFALSGTALVYAGLAWLGANILVGLGEEYLFRGYFLQSLWRSIGFWPAAILIAVLFAAAHYFFKPGENLWDVITLVTLSLWLCYTVLKTGNLWFAVGFHIAFDFMQFFVIGTPNGEQIPKGRMLDVTFHGPAWLTGGVLGTEASLLMYPLILAIWVYVWWRFREAPDAVSAVP